MQKLSKKGFSIMQVPQLGLVLVIIAIVLGLGATILTQIQTTQTTNGAAYNVTAQGLTSVATLSGWQTTWAIIIAAAVVIGILGAYLMFKNRG